MALDDLGLALSYSIERVSVADDGQWCARVSNKENGKNVSVCIEGDTADPVANIDRFKDKLTTRLNLL